MRRLQELANVARGVAKCIRSGQVSRGDADILFGLASSLASLADRSESPPPATLCPCPHCLGCTHVDGAECVNREESPAAGEVEVEELRKWAERTLPSAEHLVRGGWTVERLNALLALIAERAHDKAELARLRRRVAELEGQ